MPSKDWDRAHREDVHQRGRDFAQRMDQLRDAPPTGPDISSVEEQRRRRDAATQAVRANKLARAKEADELAKAEKLRALQALDREYRRRRRR